MLCEEFTSFKGSKPKSPGRLPVRCAGASPPGSLVRRGGAASAKRLEETQGSYRRLTRAN